MAKRKKRRKRWTKQRVPDEALRAGPLSIARFGRHTVIQNTSSTSEHAAMLDAAAKHFPVVTAEIDSLCTAIEELVASMDALKLMARAYWTHALAAVNATTESQLPHDAIVANFALAYLQSVVVSVRPVHPPTRDPNDDADWDLLHEKIRQLLATIQASYFLCKSADASRQPGFDEGLHKLETAIQMRWLTVRGERYQVHASQHLLDFLGPQRAILQSLLSVTPEQLAAAQTELAKSLMTGFGDALREAQSVHTELFSGFDADAKDWESFGSAHEFLQAELTRKGLASRMEAATERTHGYGLFDVGKVTGLPPLVLEALAFEPGGACGDGGIFDGDEHIGWPTRVSPTWERPFLKIGGSFYLFDIYLLDRLHYTVGRIIRRMQTKLGSTWANNLKDATEGVPVALISRILGPAARSEAQVFYPVPGKGRNWAECDALVTFDDVLFVVEVKSGAYTYTSPHDDFAAHVAGMRSLIDRPAEQARRFIAYLESAEEVALYDEGRTQIGRLRRMDYSHVIACCVTYDQLTHLAATLQHEPGVAPNLEGTPIWCVSVDDLRALADLFDNPVVFLHYLTKRLAAYPEQLGQLDEMDHFGAYVEYSDYVAEFSEHRDKNQVSLLQPQGYQDVVDEFFNARFLGEAPGRPTQRLPPSIEALVKHLGHSNQRNRRRGAQVLLDLSGEARTGLAQTIDDEAQRQSAGARPRLWTFSPLPLSIAVASPAWPEGAHGKLGEAAKARMLMSDHPEHVTLYITCDVAGSVSSVRVERVGRSDLPGEEREKFAAQAQHMGYRAVRQHLQTQGKIGRNEPCPCGSGKKYKKCHLD